MQENTIEPNKTCEEKIMKFSAAVAQIINEELPVYCIEYFSMTLTS